VTRVSTSIDDAVEALRDGLVVGVATDTVYGLVIDAMLPGANQVLAHAKGRSEEVPVQVLVSGFDQASSLGAWSDEARRAAGVLWPGGVTLVVPRKPGVQLDLGGDGTTVGIRWPELSMVAEICNRFGPLAATSANRHGDPPLRDAKEVATAFAGSVPLVLDGGHCSGLASTVVDLTGDEPKVLREGTLSAAEVADALKIG
jgi:tRNA threonylcarbamoyl adenosine modification protein (Sua5/YciO/YrdC/YwlC family)